MSPLSVRPWRLCGLAPAGADSATKRLVDGVERDREGEQVTVVDPAVLELPGEVTEKTGPVLPFGRDRRGDLHAPLDDPHGGQAGGGRPGLLPGSLPAGWRAPLRKSTRRLDRDCAAAPAAHRGGQPPGLHRRTDLRCRT